MIILAMLWLGLVALVALDGDRADEPPSAPAPAPQRTAPSSSATSTPPSGALPA